MMRVVTQQTGLPVDVRHVRALNIELLALAAVSLVVGFGLALTCAAKINAPDAVPHGGIVQLYALKSAAGLEPVLSMFDSPAARQAAARALFRRISAPDGIDRVGQLRDVRDPSGTPLLSRQDIVAIKPLLAVRSMGDFTRRIGSSIAIFVAAFWIAHLFRRWRRRIDDPLLLPALMLLCGIGLMAMVALRDPIRDTITAELFATGTAIGIVLMIAISEVDFESSRLRRAVILPLGLACALAAMLLIFGSGPGTSGVKVNLFGVQPSRRSGSSSCSHWPRTSDAASSCCGSCRSRRPRRGRGCVTCACRAGATCVRYSPAWRWCCCSSSSRKISGPRSS